MAELGPQITAGTTEEAAAAEFVIAATRWTDVARVMGKLPAWNNRIVIDGTNPVEFLDPNGPDANDPTNPFAAYGIKAVDLGKAHSSAVFQQSVPGARVVKAFNHLDVRLLTAP